MAGVFAVMVFCILASGVAAAPHVVESLQPRARWFNSFWTDTAASVKYKNLPGGAYSVTWNGTGNFVGGKGWNPGSTSKYVLPHLTFVCFQSSRNTNRLLTHCRTVNWTGSFEPNGYAYLTVYGWTTKPLVEYYIVENYHPDHEPAAPPEGEIVTNLTSDGSFYSVRTKMRVNKPSIEGTSTFRQIFSVRQNKRNEGVVTVGNHFAAWKEAGLETGTHSYMVMATEGNNSSGRASIEVH